MSEIDLELWLGVEKAKEYREWHTRTTAHKRCSCCHAPISLSPSWRWNGSAWEHKCDGNHPQAGYFLAEDDS